MIKLIIVGPENGGQGFYYLIAENGEALASHLCSHAGFAQSDLHDGREERKIEWAKKFPEGYEIVWLEDSGLTFGTLKERIAKWTEGNKKAETIPEPSIEITVEK